MSDLSPAMFSKLRVFVEKPGGNDKAPLSSKLKTECSKCEIIPRQKRNQPANNFDLSLINGRQTTWRRVNYDISTKDIMLLG